jgi:hypothetical protein
MTRHFRRLANLLGQYELKARLGDDPRWYPAPADAPAEHPGVQLAQPGSGGRV